MASASARSTRCLLGKTGYDMTRNHFGSRGEAWVLIQVLLFALFLLAPHVGPPGLRR
jgi:hypothetical protein